MAVEAEPLVAVRPIVALGLAKLVPAAAVACVEPSGNLTPPVVDSIIPATVRGELGAVVPIPILPLSNTATLSAPELSFVLIINPVPVPEP
jgi:hypothetical protein